MKKYKIIKILFIFILASSISNKYPLLGGLFGILLIYFLNFKDVNKKMSFRKKNLKYLLFGLVVCLLFFIKYFIGNSEHDSFLISLISDFIISGSFPGQSPSIYSVNIQYTIFFCKNQPKTRTFCARKVTIF